MTDLYKIKDMCELYYTIFNKLSEAIIIADFYGIITECNLSTVRIFGWELEELIGKKVEILIPFNYRQLYIDGLEKYQKTGEMKSPGKLLELDGLHRDKTYIPINLTVVPIIFNSSMMFAAVVREVSQKRMAEKKMNILIETLQTRVHGLEAFQFTIAHDLNAPLRAMQGFTEILVEDYAKDFNDTVKNYIYRIDTAVKRMKNLINDMLRLSRVSRSAEINRELTNISDIVNHIISGYMMMDSDRKVDLDIQTDVYDNVDKEFIEILLDNLLSNCWKFTSKKDVTKISFGKINNNNKIIYFVKDNGAGFDMCDKDKLFQPFSRLHAKKDFDGNGVGLSIVKQVANLHGGIAWAESEIDKGSTFYFTVEDNINVKLS